MLDRASGSLLFPTVVLAVVLGCAQAADIFSLPTLPYDYDALEPYIDSATMKIHHSKHHAAYVARLSATEIETAMQNCR